MKNMHKIIGGILVFVLLCSVGAVAGQTDISAGVRKQGTFQKYAPYNGTVGQTVPCTG